MLLRAILPDMLIYSLCGFIGRAESRQWIEYKFYTCITQFIDRIHGYHAKLRDIGQDGKTGCFFEASIQSQFRNSFGEDEVCSSVLVGDSPFQRFLQSFSRKRIGTCADDELIIGAGISSSFDAIGHFIDTYHFLARPVATTFGADLIFYVERGSTSLYERFYRARNIKSGRPETGIDINE